MNRQRIFVFVLLTFLVCGRGVLAYDTFHPEADPVLEEKGVWSRTVYKTNSMASTEFRVWFPFPPSQVFELLIDTNRWKEIHSDYTDSRTMNLQQYNLAAEKKPASVKEFYELMGEKILPSFYGRQPGGVWTSYVFQRLNLPWPISDRWFVIKIRNDESQAFQGEYRYDYKMLTGNGKELKGYWELLPVKGKKGWTEFRGEYKVDPGMQTPQVLGKAIFRASIRRSAKENLEALEQKAGVKQEKKSGVVKKESE